MGKKKTAVSDMSKVNAFIKASLPQEKELHYGEGENEITVKVHFVISLDTQAKMVNEIKDGVFLGDADSINDYMPEYLGFWQRYSVVSNLTDFPLPKKAEDAWMILKYTSLYDDVMEAVGDKCRYHIFEVFDSADNAIRARLQYLATKTDTNKFLKKMAETVDPLNEAIGDSSELLKAFGESTDGLGAVLGDAISGAGKQA